MINIKRERNKMINFCSSTINMKWRKSDQFIKLKVRKNSRKRKQRIDSKQKKIIQELKEKSSSITSINGLELCGQKIQF